MRRWCVYWMLPILGIRSRAEYRIDFLTAVGTAVATQLAALSFYWVVHEQAARIGTWSMAQVLLLFGLTALVLGTAELCVNGIWLVPGYIFRGELDRFLLYPLRSLPLILTARPEPHALGTIATSLVLLAAASRSLHLGLPFYALLPVWVACGVTIYTSALVAVASLYLGAVTGPFADLLLPIHQLLNAARYPISIYPSWLRTLLLVVFPIATAIFIPAQWLVGTGTLARALVAPIIAAGISVAFGALMWKRGLRRYEGPGH